MGRAILYCQCADDGGEHGGQDFQYLEYFVPIDFHFTQNKLFKKVTQKSRKSQKLCNFASKILYAMTDNEITYEIRGAIYDVYKTLGPGLLESVYEEALVFELEQRGLKVERQRQVPILYKGNVLKTDLRLDLLVEDQVIVELKSVEEMKKVFSKQLLTYLRLMNKKVGLLVNFNTDNILMSIDRVAN